MKRVAEAEHEPVIGIPEVIGITVITVKPETVLIVPDVEDVEVAVRVAKRMKCLP